MKIHLKSKISPLLLFLLIFLAWQDTIIAQESTTKETVNSDSRDIKSNHELQFGIRAFYAPATFTFIGKIESSDFIGLAIQAWHSKFNYGKFELDFGSEILVATRIKFPENGIDGPKNSKFGIGLIPAVVQVPVVNNFFLSGSGGIIIFPDEFPSRFGTRLNFVFDFGIGYEFNLSPENKIQFGYQAQHISNGGTGQINPGIDLHMLYIGFRF